MMKEPNHLTRRWSHENPESEKTQSVAAENYLKLTFVGTLWAPTWKPFISLRGSSLARYTCVACFDQGWLTAKKYLSINIAVLIITSWAKNKANNLMGFNFQSQWNIAQISNFVLNLTPCLELKSIQAFKHEIYNGEKWNQLVDQKVNIWKCCGPTKKHIYHQYVLKLFVFLNYTSVVLDLRLLIGRK